MSQKFYILGTSGSGKTYLAEKLATKYGIPHLDLDDIFYQKKYTSERNEQKKKDLLAKYLKQHKSWVIEGIFYSFTEDAIRRADKIIWLDINRNILTWRIFWRYLRGLGKRNEQFKEIIKLIIFARNYKKPNGYYQQHKQMLESNNLDYTLIRSRKQLQNFLTRNNE